MACLKKMWCFESRGSKQITKLSIDTLPKLSNFDDKTPEFTLSGLVTDAKCTKCYDADTVHLVIPYKGNYYRWTCRLEEIDSAEIKSKNKDESDFAKVSRDYLKSIILDKIISVKCGKFDKYGRLLVYLTIDGININQHLLDKGYAYKYKGGTKKEFSDWHKV